MQCRFCFATFQDVKQSVLPKGHLSEADCHKVVAELAKSGFEKITFAGGEPTLCPWLPALIQTAKHAGLTTMIVTNGTRLSEKYLDEIQTNLDWVTLSIDSLNPMTLKSIGRIPKRKGPIGTDWIYDTIARIKKAGIRFKLNTVVSAANWQEDLSAFLIATRPERWKVLQVLPIQGQNDDTVNDLLISDEQFNAFLERHFGVKNEGIPLIAEDNETMTSSYAMVDPAGRFFDNSQGTYSYSRPILSVGVTKAYAEVRVDPAKFEQREGRYHW